MKRVVLLTVLALCLVFAVVGCGDGDKGPSGNIDTSADYVTQVEQWADKWGPELGAKSDALDEAFEALGAPGAAADSHVKEVDAFAKTLQNAAKDFKSLKPSSDAKSAHDGFADALGDLGDAMGQFHKMLKKGGSPDELMETVMLLPNVMMQMEKATDDLQQVIGIDLGGVLDD